MTDPEYLLDTNICIYIRQNKPLQVIERFNALPTGSAAISVITYGELAFGVEKSRLGLPAWEALRAVLGAIRVLPVPEAAGRHYGVIRLELEDRGEVISSNDLWIASHALAAGLILVTNNEREFRRVPGLNVENWARA